MKFKEFANLDKLKHPKIEPKPVRNYDGDYKNLDIAEPSSNSSDETLKELKKMRNMFKNRSSEMEKSIEDHDKNTHYAIVKYLNDNDLKFKKSEMDNVSNVGYSIVRYYKNKFQRPRPYNLAKAMKMPFDSIPHADATTKSPAYPSGHSLQSRLVAEHYAKIYPKHKNSLIKAAEECGLGRVMAGWHYPSDHAASVKLAKQIHPNMKV